MQLKVDSRSAYLLAQNMDCHADFNPLAMMMKAAFVKTRILAIHKIYTSKPTPPLSSRDFCKEVVAIHTRIHFYEKWILGGLGLFHHRFGILRLRG